MSSYKKMVLMAEDASDDEEVCQPQTGNGVEDLELVEQMPPQAQQKKGNTIRDYAMDRQRRLLQIIMRIASIQGYNDKGNIKDKDGKFLEGTDIVPLILYSVTKERLVKGIDSYVDLLIEAKVPPEVITNENLKQRLINAGHASNRPKPSAHVPISEPEESVLPQISMDTTPSLQKKTRKKRKREISNDVISEPIEQRVTRAAKRKRQDDETEVADKIMKTHNNKTNPLGYENVSDSEDDD